MGRGCAREGYGTYPEAHRTPVRPALGLVDARVTNMEAVRLRVPLHAFSSRAMRARMRVQISYKDLALACLSAVLLILSFPKFDLNALAWVGLVPLLIALEGKGLKQAWLLSYVAGVAFFNGIFYW